MCVFNRLSSHLSYVDRMSSLSPGHVLRRMSPWSDNQRQLPKLRLWAVSAFRSAM